jgi:NAD(P)-dependent dehydrogenase (short-subunit alcohol dehydrogenase family)
MKRLRNKVTIITGAASGIGGATAKLFADEDAHVYLCDIQDDMGEGLTSEIVQSGGKANYIHLDVRDEQEWIKVLNKIAKIHGRIDVLVNNAGIGGAPLHLKIEDYPVDQWNETIAINATGVFLGTKHVARFMKKTGGGSIINMSSVYGLVGTTRGASYTASKGAVRIFTKAAAVQYSKDNIRVNSIHPGFIDTPQAAKLLSDQEVRQELINQTPVGRLGTVDDIKYGILYLASDESGYMTGSEFVIDGGITAR